MDDAKRTFGLTVEETMALREAEAAVRRAFSPLGAGRWHRLVLELLKRLMPDPIEGPDAD